MLNVSLAKLDIEGTPDVDLGRSGTRAFIPAYRDDKCAVWLECQPLNVAAALPLDQSTRLTATVWFEDANLRITRAPTRFREGGSVESPRRISLRRR